MTALAYNQDGQLGIPSFVWPAVLGTSVAIHLSLVAYGLPHLMSSEDVPEEQPEIEVVIESGGSIFESVAEVETAVGKAVTPAATAAVQVSDALTPEPVEAFEVAATTAPDQTLEAVAADVVETVDAVVADLSEVPTEQVAATEPSAMEVPGSDVAVQTEPVVVTEVPVATQTEAVPVDAVQVQSVGVADGERANNAVAVDVARADTVTTVETVSVAASEPVAATIEVSKAAVRPVPLENQNASTVIETDAASVAQDAVAVAAIPNVTDAAPLTAAVPVVEATQSTQLEPVVANVTTAPSTAEIVVAPAEPVATLAPETSVADVTVAPATTAVAVEPSGTAGAVSEVASATVAAVEAPAVTSPAASVAETPSASVTSTTIVAPNAPVGVTEAKRPPPSVVAALSRPTAQTVEAAPSPSSPAENVPPVELATIDPLADVASYVAGYDAGSCAHLSVMSAGMDTASVVAFGNDIAPIIAFDKQFKTDQGFEASIEMRQVTRSQCALLEALGVSGGIEAVGLIELDRTVVRSGTNLSGVIERDLPLEQIQSATADGVPLNGMGPPEIYLIDADGQIHDGRSNILPESSSSTAGGWRFRMPVVLLSALDEEPALVLAVWNRPKDNQPGRFRTRPARDIARVLAEPGVFSLSAFKVSR